MLLDALLAAAVAAAALGAAQPGPDGDWSWPVDPPRRVLAPFVAPLQPWAPGHRGIDVAAPGGVLRAPADGVVHFAGQVVDRPVLSIDHGEGVLSSYEPVVASVVEGESVRRGEVIGVIEAGHCATTCVHVGVRVDGEYRNPLLWLGGAIRPVLLPTRRG